MSGKVIVSYSVTLREDDERFFEDLREILSGGVGFIKKFKIYFILLIVV